VLQLSLASPARRAAALLLGLGILAVFAAGIVRWFEAARGWGAEDKPALERALGYAADDARLHHRLGRWEQFSLAEGDLGRAVTHYRRAAALNPYESLYWLDLADALQLAGDAPGAQDALGKALQADPRTPDTLWRIGNFWLRTSTPERAFPYFRQVLATRPLLTPLVIQVCHRTFRDPELLLREVLPPEAPYLLSYLRQLVRAGESDPAGAARVWAALIRLRHPFDPHEALPYLDFLIRMRELQPAIRAWSDLKAAGLLGAAADSPPGELLHNPDLRAPILNGGFDWRVEPAPHVTVTLGPGRRGEQPPAVAIQFSGEENLHYRGFYQYVVVEPNRRYRFRAWLRAQGITTESGLRLEVADGYAPERNVARSPGLVGNTDWVAEEVEFAAGPETRLLRVGLVRLPSHRLTGEIRGRVEAGEFSLTRAGK